MKKSLQITTKLLLCLITAGLIFGGCKKEEVKGPQGDPGPNGTGGNANTSSSAIFVVGTSQWTSGTSQWEYTYNSGLITKTAADNGAVKVFKEVNGTWWELPFAEGDLMTQCGFSEGKVKLVHIDIHGGLPPSAPTTANYRLVVLSESAKPPKANNNDNLIISNQKNSAE